MNTVIQTARKPNFFETVRRELRLRNLFMTYLLASRVDVRYIQKLPGHKSSKITEIYTQVSKKTLGKIVSPLDSVIGLKTK